MNLFKRINLTAKLFIINFGSVFFFAAVLLFIFNRGINMQRNVIGQNMQLYSDVLVKTISEVFHAKYHNIQAIAKNSVLKTTDKEEIRFVLDEMMTLYPSFSYMLLVGTDGKLIASNTVDNSGKKINHTSIEGVNFKDQDWFEKAKAQKFTEDLKKNIFGTYVGEVLKDQTAKELYGSSITGNHFSTIVDDGFGDVQAILVVFSRTDWIESALSDLYRSTNTNSEAELAFFNKQGQYIALAKANNSGEISSISGSVLGSSVLSSSKIGSMISTKGHGTVQDKSLVNSNKEMYYAGSKVAGDKFIDSIGWSVVIGLPPAMLFLPVNNLKSFFYLCASVLLIISALINFFGGRIASVPIQKIAQVLSGNSLKVNEAAIQIEEASSMLTTNTANQTSSIEEISASLESTSEMIATNVESSRIVTNLANDTHTEAQSGKEVMNDLKDSITEIMESNKNIEQLQEVINSIGEKTKVIDEIVFQTKLLSFNASVEAERAGEHGRGFAVVAQEVGNLASMSGTAATEIASIVRGSIDKAVEVVADNRKKVQKGSELSVKTSEVLESIERKTSQVKEQSEQITTASEEQAGSIRDITNAITQIDEITKQVSLNAREFAETGREMGVQADDLDCSVSSLLTIINGESKELKATICESAPSKEVVENVKESSKKTNITSVDNSGSWETL